MPGKLRSVTFSARYVGLFPWFVLLTHSVLLGWIGLRNCPVYDEVAHLPSGISHWRLGHFRLYQVNPPLVRSIAAIPVLASNARTDWSLIGNSPYGRYEFVVGKRFLRENQANDFWYFTYARWACIPLSVCGGWICYRWATELFGRSSGIVALLLWSFCPNVLAWGSTILPDAGGASLGVAAAYAFWHWLRFPSWRRALIAGTVLGLAELTKSTWIVLFGLWPAIWTVCNLLTTPTEACRKRSQFCQLIVMLTVGIYALNLGYLFEGTFKRLDSFHFISQTLGGDKAHEETGNRFRGSLVGSLLVPFPENYIHGLDVQKYDFERRKWSYLCGTQKPGGWYHYYLYGMLIKTPIGTLLLAAFAMAMAFLKSEYRIAWRSELVVIAPALTVFFLVSSQDGFSRYLRYALPVLPFVYVWISRVARCFDLRHGLARVTIVVLLTLSIGSSLRVFPHSMSYFNALAGGPEGGHAHLVDASIDWGQDLLTLRRWLGNHPKAQPMHLAYFGYVDPKLAGMDLPEVPPVAADSSSELTDSEGGPVPGWFAVSVNHLRGYRHDEESRPIYTYFRNFEPYAMAGYSIYIYHISPDDANRVRKSLGMSPLLMPNSPATEKQ